MQAIIHDLEDELFQTLRFSDDLAVIHAKGKYAFCQGCFKCWLKNPGYCVMGDSIQHIGATIGASDQLVIISRITYGGYSSPVKKVLDRSIGTSLPFFTYRGWQTHHMKRYRRKQNLRVYLYGSCSALEKETAKKLIEMNRINMGMKESTLQFLNDAEDLRGCPI